MMSKKKNHPEASRIQSSICKDTRTSMRTHQRSRPTHSRGKGLTPPFSHPNTAPSDTPHPPVESDFLHVAGKRPPSAKVESLLGSRTLCTAGRPSRPAIPLCCLQCRRKAVPSPCLHRLFFGLKSKSPPSPHLEWRSGERRNASRKLLSLALLHSRGHDAPRMMDNKNNIFLYKHKNYLLPRWLAGWLAFTPLAICPILKSSWYGRNEMHVSHSHHC